ncbi:replication endonuclease [Collimonas pratensis]|uniref:Bacteriophage replication gene A family protein n=1 Tax=Collimonas pratensis TaxID=279113 RepID=A0ABN4M9S9_9BURK|nr:replication endonuclease [Collimonas pratensis]AMP14881.1 bacteriophage replication gene A family protein [Collimonas pratensis]
MPVIQQENGVKSVKGLPIRWGIKAYKELKAARGDAVGGDLPAPYIQLSKLLDDVTDAPLPLDGTDAKLCSKAQKLAQACLRKKLRFVDQGKLRARLESICRQNGIAPPALEKDRDVVARCCDPAWWRRQLRKVHGRAFEHAAIRLGFVSSRTGSYVSDETVRKRMEQNRRNARILASVKMENNLDQAFALAELVEKSTSNKANRRGELMVRMKGMETIAKECGHDGIFVTATCPSKYHAVIQGTGRTNPNYQGASPIEAQAYLNKTWARQRAALEREGINIYGLRIAEPHHDGCPHWHMLLFIEPLYCSRAAAKRRVKRIFKRYAWAEDRGEPGCFKQRVKLIDIDWSKGDAAGYIAKYVGKNIDDEHVGVHTQDGVEVQTDLTGDQVIKPCQRVEAWAAIWGIRQFQQIGGAPVGVWRELRRVEEKTVRNSPGYVLDAWQAAQKIEVMREDKLVTEKSADFAGYIKAQGGVTIGRQYRIGIAKREAEMEGRYGLSLGEKPVGIYAKENAAAVYESTRYTWRRAAGGVAVAVPWTRVNNCTQPSWTRYATEPAPIERFTDAEWFASIEYRQLQDIHERYYEF